MNPFLAELRQQNEDRIVTWQRERRDWPWVWIMAVAAVCGALLGAVHP